MGNRGRSSDPNDTIRLLKSKVRSLEREIQRLRKANGRFVEPSEDEEESSDKGKKTKQTRPVENSTATCDRCGSNDVAVMELPIREETKVYVTCYNCGSRKKTTKR